MSLDFVTIGELGTKDFLRVNKNDSISGVIKEMSKEGVDRALVYSDDEPEGIVTKKDIVSRVGSSRRRRIPPSSLHVSSFMSFPLLILPEDILISKAARVMLDAGISSIPAHRSREVISLFSKWDIAKVLIKEASPIEDIMSRKVVWIMEDDSLIKARKLMVEEGLSTLPVMNADGKVIGIVTVTELMDALIEILDVLAESGARNALKRIRVGEIMRPLIPSLRPDDTIGMAAALMIEKSIRGVLVMNEEGGLEGLVTLTDLTRFVVK